MDTISWKLAVGEWESNEESEGLITSFDGGATYYYTHDIERFLDDEESKDNVYCD